jgi:hypothetical protein
VAANYIRWELLSLAEKYGGPQGSTANHRTVSTGGAADPATGPDNLLQWADFHLKAKELPPDLREVFDLIWYNGTTQKEAAEILGVPERTLRRRWLSARLALNKACNGEAPNFDWSSCADPAPLLEYVRDGASDRKLRLFALACCRPIADGLSTGLLPSMLDVAERYADGLATDEERRMIRTKARRAVQGCESSEMQIAPSWVWREATATYYATARNAWRAASKARQEVVEALAWPDHDPEGCTVAEVRTVELARQSALVRDIFADAVRPVRFDPRWRTADVIGLAEGIYQDRAFDRLPILADALMDAGCADEDVLGHCRSEGLHARGCWVVDLALGKR